MKKSVLSLMVLVSIVSVPENLSAKSKHKHECHQEQSMIADIMYTTVGAGCLIAAIFAGKFTLNTYSEYKAHGHAAVANNKGFATNDFIMWYKEHAKVMVPVEIIGLGFLTGILGSTGIHCIAKGMHLRD